jgi:cytochrome-b5 reductase
MSRHLGGLPLGASLRLRGPLGRFALRGAAGAASGAAYTLDGAQGVARHINLVAGGSGITCCVAIAEAALADASPSGARVALLFSNRAEGDVLLRPRLEALAAAHPTRFALRLTLTAPGAGGAGWRHGRGRVDADMLRAHLAPPGAGVISLVCGPDGLVESVTAALTGALGHAASRVVAL